MRPLYSRRNTYKYYLLGSEYKGEDLGMVTLVDPGQEGGLILTI